MNPPQVVFKSDEMVPNAGTFFLKGEDHTLGNLLRMELLFKQPNILFAGYKIPHPTSDTLELRVQTVPPGTGAPAKTPIQALLDCCNNLNSQLAVIEDKLRMELNN